MDIKTKIDIESKIFENCIASSILKEFTQIIDKILVEFEDSVELRTRRSDNTILFSGSTKYFTVDSKNESSEQKLIFAGALHTYQPKTKIPSIRVRDNNPVLKILASKNKFRFNGERTEDWTCVRICKETLPIYETLLVEEIHKFFDTK
jgi:hypothetical protein